MSTCSKVEHDITEKDGIRDDIEDDSGEGEIIIEEWDGHGEDDEVGDEEEEHADVPVEPEGRHRVDDPRALGHHMTSTLSSVLDKAFLGAKQLGC